MAGPLTPYVLLVLYLCGLTTLPPLHRIPLPDAETCGRVATLVRSEAFDLRVPGVVECRPLGGGEALEPCIPQEWNIMP